MNNHKTRSDDYIKRKKHLENLTDKELKQRFWDLADKATEPLIDLAYKNTSPAIERSVLLRMGFSSIEVTSLVEKVINHGLISKGAGHVVFRYSKIQTISIRESGLALNNDQGWQEVMDSFGVKS
ncbi:MAG: ornithine aminomutase subunit alpha [Tenericutes bacterium]|nr:ornithine aminomutase subunit alpha [Mycoplasmatota bacterium]